jgi:hypothetical protein
VEDFLNFNAMSIPKSQEWCGINEFWWNWIIPTFSLHYVQLIYALGYVVGWPYTRIISVIRMKVNNLKERNTESFPLRMRRFGTCWTILALQAAMINNASA